MVSKDRLIGDLRRTANILRGDYGTDPYGGTPPQRRWCWAGTTQDSVQASPWSDSSRPPRLSASSMPLRIDLGWGGRGFLSVWPSSLFGQRHALAQAIVDAGILLHDAAAELERLRSLVGEEVEGVAAQRDLFRARAERAEAVLARMRALLDEEARTGAFGLVPGEDGP